MSYKQTSPNWAYLTKNLSIILKMGPHHILPVFYCFTSLWAQLGPLPCEYLGEFDSKYFIALITCLKWTKILIIILLSCVFCACCHLISHKFRYLMESFVIKNDVYWWQPNYDILPNFLTMCPYLYVLPIANLQTEPILYQFNEKPVRFVSCPVF